MTNTVCRSGSGRRLRTPCPLFSVPLGLLDIDPWAVELGGGVKDAALDGAAHAVVRAFERPKWWVP